MPTSVPNRVFLIVMDSAGIGALPDADRYGDTGSNTLKHIAERVPLRIPTLRRMGLDRVVDIGGDAGMAPVPASKSKAGAFGRMAEASPGKDSVTGHWEIAGVVLDGPFPTFPSGFAPEVIAEFERRIGRRSIGNVVGSGTDLIDQYGPLHVRTGEPIVYTSADSVFQIAAHEDVIPLPELYRMCDAAFDVVVRRLGVGRVIARPFVGVPGAFVRTPNRRDFARPPAGRTLLDRMSEAGHTVVGLGKIDDLFAGRGVTRARHTTSDAHGMDLLEEEIEGTRAGLVFLNLVDFDTEFGHRNDVGGYAANLERFDARLARVLSGAGSRDLLIVTADHGNDPTTVSTDHSREYVPVLIAGPAVADDVDLGTRSTFADLGQTIASLFGVAPLDHGTSFLDQVLR